MFDFTPRNSHRGKSSSLLAKFVMAAVGLGFVSPAHAAIYTYDNTTAGAIPQVTAANCGLSNANTGLQVDFVVAEPTNFSVTGVALGLAIDHDDREQIRAILRAPDTTTFFQFIAGVDDGTDNENDFDIMMSTNGEGALDDGTDDPLAAPNYSRMVSVAGANFYAGAVNGTWRLFLCDIDTGSTPNGGTFQGARLVVNNNVTLATGEVCSEKATFEWCTSAGGGAGCDDDVVALNTAFPVTNTDGVTMTLFATADPGADGSAAAFDPYLNLWSLQGEQLGGEFGFFHTGMNIAPDTDIETAMLATTWNFARTNAPTGPIQVSGLEIRALDVDFSNGANTFEDVYRANGYPVANGLGTLLIPFVQTLGTRNEAAGDLVEGDSEELHADPALSGANVLRTYLRGVASVAIGYTADVGTVPAIQYVGLGNPRFCVFDFGDALDTYGTNSNTTAARHVLGQRRIFLGALPPDGELTGRANAAATGDNATAPLLLADEDGVATFPVYTPGSTTYTVSVNATNTSGAGASLVGYIDWNNNGVFDNLTVERSATVSVASGSLTDFAPTATNFNVVWTGVPANPGTAARYARFRISSSAAAVTSPTGFAPDGEVEDYLIPLNTLPVTLAWVESSVGKGGLEVRWATSMEDRNGGFRIWGLGAGGERRLLGFEPSRVVDSFAPQSYSATFSAPDVVAVEIEDIAIDGKNRLHGPFTVGKPSGERPVADRINWDAIRSELEPAAQQAAQERGSVASEELARPAAGRALTVATLQVRDEGIQRVTFEDLLAKGIDLSGVPGNRLAVFDNGKMVSRYANQQGSFGPGSFLEFVAHPQTTLESPYDAFELRIDRKPVQNPPSISGGSGVTVVVRDEARHHPEARYSPSSPNGDPWYDTLLLARPGIPTQATRGFDLPDLDSGTVELTVDLWGYSYFGDAAPDHHVVLRLNGDVIADEQFDGLTVWTRTLDVTSKVQETGNELRIEIPGDVPYLFDVVNLEGFSLSYPRRSVALDGRFHFEGNGGGGSPLIGYAVDGFAGPSVAVWTLSGSRLSRGEIAPVGGRVAIADRRSEAYFAEPAAVRKPEVEAGAAKPLYSSTAEYVVLTDSAFASDLGSLVSLEESRGFSTEVVTVDRIYSAYNDHAPSVEALRQFLSQSKSLRYVLIVGAASSDPWNHLGIGSISYVPTAYLPVVEDVSFSPTDEFIADLDGDGFPDVPIGRLPVRTPSELENAIDKILAWEANVGVRQALLVAGTSDVERGLAEINETYDNAIPSWSTTLAQVDDIGVPSVRQATIDGMNAGVPLVSFVGHSSASVWDYAPVLQWQDVDAFTNVGRPNLVTQWGCWSSYYVEPNYQSMSGRMMNAQDKGAAATIGASTLTTEPSHRRLGQLFFQQLEAGVPRLGDAFLAAKRVLREEGSPDDAIFGMMLLGDPAMTLPNGQTSH